jgi:hypothetical protein
MYTAAGDFLFKSDLIPILCVPPKRLKQRLDEARLRLRLIILTNYASRLFPPEFLNKMLNSFSCSGLIHGWYDLH